MISLDDETKVVMEEVMTDWRDHRRGNGGNDSSIATGGSAANGAAGMGNVNIPLGPGEWDEGLGVPLCVVCQGVSFSRLRSKKWLHTKQHLHHIGR